MTEIVIRNQDVLDQLEYVRSKVMGSGIGGYDSAMYKPADAMVNGSAYMTKDYLDKHMDDPDHAGFPVEHYSIPVEHVIDKDPKLEEIYNFSRVDFISNLGGNANAVFLYYPPGGFVGWHTTCCHQARLLTIWQRQGTSDGLDLSGSGSDSSRALWCSCLIDRLGIHAFCEGRGASTR